MRLCVLVCLSVCLFVCGIKKLVSRLLPEITKPSLGKSITVLLLGIAATNSVTKMKTTEHA